MYCNQILNCDYGIIGTGPIVDQGSASGGGGGNFEDWSNRFCDSFANHSCLNGSSSVYADLVWWSNYKSDTVKIYIDTLTLYRELKGLIGNIILDNQTPPINDSMNRAQFKVNLPTINQSIDYFCTGGLFNSKYEDNSWSEVSKINNFKVYPNPAIDELIIERDESDFDLYEIEIYDLLGQKKLTFQNQNIYTYIPVYNFPQGLYIVSIVNKNTGVINSFKVNIIR
jgi:hypothetical protein